MSSSNPLPCLHQAGPSWNNIPWSIFLQPSSDHTISLIANFLECSIVSQIKYKSWANPVSKVSSIWPVSFRLLAYWALDCHLSQPWCPLPPHISPCPKLNRCPRMFFVPAWPRPAFVSRFWLMPTCQCSIPRQLEPSVNCSLLCIPWHLARSLAGFLLFVLRL